MKSILATVLIGLSLGAVAAGQETLTDSEQFGLEHLTEFLGLKPSDIAFRSDYTDPDSLRLRLVAGLMRSPLRVHGYVASLRNAHVRGQPDILAGVIHADMALEYQRERGRPHRPELAEIRDHYTLAYTNLALNGLLTKAAAYLDAIFPGSTALALPDLTDRQRRYLTAEFRDVLAMREDEEFLSVAGADSLEKKEEAYVEEFVKFAGKIQKDPIVSAGVDCLRDILPDIAAVRAEAANNANVDRILATTGYVPKDLVDAAYLGRQPGWKVGGPGNDYYQGDYKFILDIGGDDIYVLTYDPSNPHGVIIIDLAGDDLYRAGSDFALGSGCLSVGLLLDYAGDDRYDARSFGLGSGWFGLGLLYDAAGDDRYDGDTHVQGAGTFGVGLLIDDGGRDIYNAAVFAQGLGFVEGVGLIFEAGGSDSYYAGGKYKDINRYEDHYLSMSQGMGYGIRPWISGGVGAIIDLGGSDNYTADIYGQGSAYWWSLGVLYDSAGLDSYQCYQYGQGVATHMAIGFLMDESGKDGYYGKGVMQGCGHDYAFGWLLDRGGDDTYTGYDKVQGDGSANGIGLLMDIAGADRYFSSNPTLSQGAGDPRRGFGSIGLFMDLGGKDQYDGNGRDNFYWEAVREYGGGMDIELSPVDSVAKGD
ncbi:MAG: hypothetical protein AB1772_04220 [Candidatus Zixiibacteriota bacterium]